MNNLAVVGVTQEPLSAFVDQYRSELERLKYGRNTIRVYLRSIDRLCRLADDQGVAPGEMTPDIAAELMLQPPLPRDRHNYSVCIARRFVGYLVSLGVAKAPAPPTASQLARAALRCDYEDYLRRQRGLSERTIFHCWRFADRFLDFRFGASDLTLSAITPADIVAFLQLLTTRKVPFRDKTPPTHLRSLFQYLFKCGHTPTNLALCVPSVAQRHGARLPRHLAPDQVEAVLAAGRSDPRNGRRNHAMLLLLARLGLRAPEVIAVQLDDIDWRSGELVVRGKGQQHDRMPIAPDVGAALADYIRNDRVSTSRALFVSARAPHDPFKNGQVLNSLLKVAFARTAISPPSPYVGSHVLRHSLAINLMRKGASLSEVGEVLRHRSRVSTLIYAKVDIESLRSIARSWPVVGGAS